MFGMRKISQFTLLFIKQLSPKKVVIKQPIERLAVIRIAAIPLPLLLDSISLLQIGTLFIIMSMLLVIILIQLRQIRINCLQEFPIYKICNAEILISNKR